MANSGPCTAAYVILRRKKNQNVCTVMARNYTQISGASAQHQTSKQRQEAGALAEQTQAVLGSSVNQHAGW